MTFDDCLALLADAGLPLAVGRTKEDLLSALRTNDNDEVGLHEILLALASEVRTSTGQTLLICDRAWTLDAECVEGQGAYVDIGEQLIVLSGTSALTDMSDHIDFDAGRGWFEYTIDGSTSRWDVEVHDDWADLMTINYLAHDLRQAHPPMGFWCIRHGQCLSLFWLSEGGAATINTLAEWDILEQF